MLTPIEVRGRDWATRNPSPAIAGCAAAPAAAIVVKNVLRVIMKNPSMHLPKAFDRDEQGIRTLLRPPRSLLSQGSTGFSVPGVLRYWPGDTPWPFGGHPPHRLPVSGVI